VEGNRRIRVSAGFPSRFLMPEGFPRPRAPPPLPHGPEDGLSRRNRAQLRRLLLDGGRRYREIERD
jgi:hypothetical protein